MFPVYLFLVSILIQGNSRYCLLKEDYTDVLLEGENCLEVNIKSFDLFDLVLNFWFGWLTVWEKELNLKAVT